MTREESFAYYQQRTAEELFEVKETKLAVPEPARIFDSYNCECCGEKTGANWIRLVNGQKFCSDMIFSFNTLKI